MIDIGRNSCLIGYVKHMPTKNQTRYSLQDCEKFAAKYWELGSAVKAGQELDIDPYFIRSAVKRIGHNPKDYAVHACSMKRQLPDDMSSVVVSDFKSGMTYAALSEKYSVTKNAIRECIERAGARERRRGPFPTVTEDDKIEIKKLFDSGMPVCEIRKIIKVSHGCVRKTLHEFGIKHLSRPKKAERVVLKNGYAMVLMKFGDPFFSMATRSFYVLEHRLVMARSLGRVLDNHETVHHINGQKSDNRIENLQLLSGKHGKGVVHRCRCCGSIDIESSEIASEKLDQTDSSPSI
jgi:HNH endonuclease